MKQLNMWNLDLNIEPMETVPEAIVDEYCKDLIAYTEGKIVAKVFPYSGPTSDYERTEYSISDTFKQAFHNPAFTTVKKSIKIQADLGGIGEGPTMYFAYEFFITSPHMPNYKYRIMFFTYTAQEYPIGIVLSEDIAEFLEMPQNFKCETEENFRDTLQKIVESKPVQQVIRTLYKTTLLKGKKPLNIKVINS
ncbi:MAG: hypothetical protein FWG64_01995 [Firmicutes bacterium]|nr:hypothetical protein [Bacillota bacterium]